MTPMNDTEVSDAELVERVRTGETEAFDEIDRRYREPLCRFLRRFTYSFELAEELAQRTLIRAFEMIGQLQSAEKLAGWLHRIACRMAAAEGRRRKTVPLGSICEPSAMLTPAVELEEQKRNLWQIAEQTLSADEFKILVLRYRDDLPLAQIAEQLDKNEGAVRVQLHRARKKLMLKLP